MIILTFYIKNLSPLTCLKKTLENFSGFLTRFFLTFSGKHNGETMTHVHEFEKILVHGFKPTTHYLGSIAIILLGYHCY